MAQSYPELSDELEFLRDRDIGVGADVFFVKGEEAMDVRSGALETREPARAETEASKAKAREAAGVVGGEPRDGLAVHAKLDGGRGLKSGEWDAA